MARTHETVAPRPPLKRLRYLPAVTGLLAVAAGVALLRRDVWLGILPLGFWLGLLQIGTL